MSVGLDNLILLPDSVKEETRRVALQGASVPINQEHVEGEKAPRERKWKIGELEFEAMMRQLDNMVWADKPIIIINMITYLLWPNFIKLNSHKTTSTVGNVQSKRCDQK